MTTDKATQETFWKEFASSPYIMMRLDGSNEHAEPMTAQLDKGAQHAVWFYLARDNRISAGGPAMGAVATKGHDVFASITGTLTAETDPAVREKHWDNVVEAWFPNGKNDPDVLMHRFDIDQSEVWISDTSLQGRLKRLVGVDVNAREGSEHGSRPV